MYNSFRKFLERVSAKSPIPLILAGHKGGVGRVPSLGKGIEIYPRARPRLEIDKGLSSIAHGEDPPFQRVVTLRILIARCYRRWVADGGLSPTKTDNSSLFFMETRCVIKQRAATLRGRTTNAPGIRGRHLHFSALPIKNQDSC